MSAITKHIAINATADTVWRVLADFGAVEKWAPTVARSRASSDIQRSVGAKRALSRQEIR